MLDLVVHSHNQRLVVNDLHRTDFTIGIPGMFYVLSGKPLFSIKVGRGLGKLFYFYIYTMTCGVDISEKNKKSLALKPSPCDGCHSSQAHRLAASFMEVISCRLFSFSTSAWAKCLFTMPFKKTQLQITVKTNKICSKYEVTAKLQATSSNYNEGTFPKLTCSNCFILDAVRKSRTAALTRPEKGEACSSPI